jgi:hypothetical protein
LIILAEEMTMNNFGKIVLIGLIAAMPSIGSAQSVTIYLCNDCTYRSARDGETITFLESGKVKINGKPAPYFRCLNNDGIIELRYKGKLINNLNWYTAQAKGYELLDDRGIGYSLVKCTGNMPSMSELNNPDTKRIRRRK